MSGRHAPDEQAKARLRGKRVALALYGTFATVFVAMCTWQIVIGVFGLGAAPLAPLALSASAASVAPRDCVDDIRALRAALDRAFAMAVTSPDDAAALSSYRHALSPEWDGERAASERCAREPRGTDAFAALLRLRVAQEASLHRQVGEMAPLRRDLAAYVP